MCFVNIFFQGNSQTLAPLFTGSSIFIDADALRTNKEIMKLQNGTTIKTADWNNYLSKLVLQFPAAKADSIVDGLTRYSYEYDKVEKMIRLEPDKRETGNYTGNSYISFYGFIKDSKIIPFVKFNYSGSDWIYANRIKMVCDNDTYEFDSLKFYTHGTLTYVSEYVLFPYTKEMQLMVEKIIKSKETIIRFYCDPNYSDLVVTEWMKFDMEKFLKTIKALQ